MAVTARSRALWRREADLEQSGILKRTPLHARHAALGARMVDFAGWEMPVQYRGDHRRAQGRAHRGGPLRRLPHGRDSWCTGPRALDARAAAHLQRRGAAGGRPGAVLGAARRAQGGIVDDIMVYRLAADRFLLVRERGQRRQGLRAGCASICAAGARADHESDRWALIALQGPAASRSCSLLTPARLARSAASLDSPTRRSRGATRMIAAHRLHRRGRLRALLRRPETRRRSGTRCSKRASRTGSSRAGSARATRCGSRPAWRSTATTSTRPHAARGGAGLGGQAGQAGGFVGSEALARQKAEGVPRKLVGFEHGGARHRAPRLSGATGTGRASAWSPAAPIGPIVAAHRAGLRAARHTRRAGPRSHVDHPRASLCAARRRRGSPFYRRPKTGH